MVEGQIYNWHATARRTLGRLHEDPVTSARELLQKSDVDVEVLDLEVPEGYEALGFALKEVMGQYANRVEEIAMDSTCEYLP